MILIKKKNKKYGKKIDWEKLYGLTPPFCRLPSINVGKDIL